MAHHFRASAVLPVIGIANVNVSHFRVPIVSKGNMYSYQLHVSTPNLLDNQIKVFSAIMK